MFSKRSNWGFTGEGLVKSPLGQLFYMIFLMAVLFATAEFLLEIRAIQRGFSGYWIELLQGMFSSHEAGANGDRQSSAVMQQIATGAAFSRNMGGAQRSIRIVVAGSSETIDPKFPEERRWPSRMVERLNKIGQSYSQTADIRFESMNASWIGTTFRLSCSRIESILKEHHPDVLLVYLMSNSISQYSREIQNDTATAILEKPQDCGGISAAKEPDYSLLNLLGFRQMATQFFGNTVIYEHLKSKVGTQIVDFMKKENEIGYWGEALFLQDLERYLILSKKYQVQLVLAEFAPVVGEGSDESTIRKYVEPFFRYNTLLSERGWMKTVSRLNMISREFSEKHGLSLISTRSTMVGREEYFRDLVHFTELGHDAMGKAMADAYMQTLLK